MVDAPWLTIVGLGEDGLDGLSAASRAALDEAEVVFGAKRHLGLVPKGAAEQVEWPVPFADGIPLVKAHRGRRVVVLASGDPFWYGAGTTLSFTVAPNEMRVLPGVSCFSLAAARLGWPLERVTCLGLHAAPFEILRTVLAPEVRVIATLRDGAAVGALADYLTSVGYAESRLTVMEALGGPRERVTEVSPMAMPETAFVHPLVVAIYVRGNGRPWPCASGREDDWFESDGQITKRPVRALTLSALAPRPGEYLWDIGSGSGSIALEWLASHPTLGATAVERRADRGAQIKANASRLGLAGRLNVTIGEAPEVLETLAVPSAVFIGGGLSEPLLDTLTGLPSGTRVVANSVTLETEALLTAAQTRVGGTLMRVELSEATPLGSYRGWQPSRPIVQWSATL